MFTAIKQLGQNFLTDFSIVNRMIDLLDLRNGDEVIEIGPGLGVLTEELAQRLLGLDYRLYAVEIDERFVAKLSQMYAINQDVTVVHADILEWLPSFMPEKQPKILGSLPFYITSPILHGIAKMRTMPELCVLLIQDEVAKKVVASAPESSYLSVFIQTFFRVSYEFKVDRNVFKPAPKVNGAVIRLVKKSGSYSADFINGYEEFLHKGFKFPRKMLNKAFDKDIINKLGIDPNARPGALSADQWLSYYTKWKNL